MKPPKPSWLQHRARPTPPRKSWIPFRPLLQFDRSRMWRNWSVPSALLRIGLRVEKVVIQMDDKRCFLPSAQLIDRWSSQPRPSPPARRAMKRPWPGFRFSVVVSPTFRWRSTQEPRRTGGRFAGLALGSGFTGAKMFWTDAAPSQTASSTRKSPPAPAQAR